MLLFINFVFKIANVRPYLFDRGSIHTSTASKRTDAAIKTAASSSIALFSWWAALHSPVQWYHASLDLTTVSPTSLLPTLRFTNQVELKCMKWGYKPAWSKKLIINARTDTVQSTKQLWGNVKKNHRCIVVVQGFYEWKDKLPWLIEAKDEVRCSVSDEVTDGEFGHFAGANQQYDFPG